jgi:ATP-dependent Lhr-like helicase
MQSLRPLLEIQQRWSALPDTDTLVIESMKSREGYHLFVYPFAGRSVHMGLASLLGYRVGRIQPITFSIAINDYGFELLAPEPVDWAVLFAGETGAEVGLFDTETLLEDVLGSLNATQLSRQRFREVARIAGLIFQGYPGQPKSTRQLQASRGAGTGAGAHAPARHAHRAARAPRRLPRGQARDPVRLPADGRALSRKSHHRKALRPRGAHGA